jgi:tRNA 2-thiouridine synthesizing protein A
MSVKFEKSGDAAYLLDVTGYTCPHPQMYTKKALQKMESGAVLTLVFDNTSSGESIISMCESNGDELFDRADAGGTFTWKIRKG